MGTFSSWAEPFIQGGTFGLSNLLGITGKEGLIHDGDDDAENQAIWLEEEGLGFRKANILIPWSEVLLVNNMMEENGVFLFMLKGGLRIITGWVFDHTEGNTDIQSAPTCSRQTVFDLDVDTASAKDYIAVAEDLLWAVDLANHIRHTDEHLPIDEGWLFRSLVLTLFYVEGQLSLDEGNVFADDQEKQDKASSLVVRLRESLEKQFGLTDISDADAQAAANLGLRILSDVDFGRGIAWQKKVYEEYCASIRYAGEEDVVLPRSALNEVLMSTKDEDRPLGDEAWKSERKTIICTDQPMALSAFSKRKRLEGIMVMDAADIELYNEEVPAELKLVFPAGHPQNGCTYIQHPLQANLYFEVNEFHDSLLERKQNELLRILESLGAYSARVEVRHERREDTSFEAEVQRDGKGSHGVVKGSAAYNGSESRQALSAFSQSATKDWTFNPPEKPGLPDNLVFYPTEETWKNLAASVLRGGLKQATVDLEYKSEYGVTEKRLSDIAASARAVLPSFEMHLKSSFSSNLHRLTSTQWHYEAIFENEEGKRAGDFAPLAEANVKAPALGGAAAVAALPPLVASSSPKPSAAGDAEKVEALFRKRAKRYAQSEGHIDATQRADLEAFAQKYGIDEFRMEELIEEAFE